MKTLHIEDRNVAFNFIDAVRIKRNVSVKLAIVARHLAEHININPNQTDARLANAIAKQFESGRIK